jgi:hypothetical protein
MHSSAAYGCNNSLYGDKRLDKRFNKIIDKLEAKPNTSVVQAFCDSHQSKACYRFWDNEKVTPELILLHHKEETISLTTSQKVILSIQDTTDIDFTARTSVEGLGYLEGEHLKGIKVHTAISVSNCGQPLGILWQKQWVRKPEEYGKRHERKNKPTEQKESQRWIDCHNEINEEIPATTTVIHIADRESDIYDLLSSPRTENQHLLIRFVQNRRVNDNEHKRMKEALAAAGTTGALQIKVARKKSQESRIATVTVKYVKLEIRPPKNRKTSTENQPVTMTAIRIKEEAPPKGITGIEWFLLTTVPVNSIEDVKQCAKYYTYRWLIERYHYILKSGCQVEELQLETAARLMNAIATYCTVGWRIFFSTYLARNDPEADARTILSQDELEVLYLKFNPKAEALPMEPLKIKETVIMIARLGGFMARKRDGMPGPKTIWRGFLSLESMVQGWVIARNYFAKLSKNKILSSFPNPGTYG